MANYTILIIDYEPRSIQKLREPLEAAGYKVEVARDGVSGMAMFDKLKPSLTLVEAMLPKKHGFEVCQELKQTPHGQKSPVLIITSVYKGRKYRHQALHHYRCDEYLEKPISGEALLAVIKNFLKGEPDRTAALETSRPIANISSDEPVADDDAHVIEADSEIEDHLDSLLSDEPSPTSQDRSGTVPRSASDNVVAFDPERVRKRPPNSTLEPSSVSSTVSMGGTAAARGAAEPVLQSQISELQPQLEAPAEDVVPREAERAQPLAIQAKPDRLRMGRAKLWLWLALLAILLSGAAAVLL